MKQQKRDGRSSAEIPVKALFLDYDGTISRLNVSMSESMVPLETVNILKEIKEKIPVSVITTKDLSFIEKKTPFANAWSGLGGLETKIGNAVNSVLCPPEKMRYLNAGLKYAKNLSGNGFTVEEKRNSEGAIVAFSVDWRRVEKSRDAPRRATKIISYCETLPIFTIKYQRQPFFDVFACPINKGKALLKLKRKLGLWDGVLYMGDSTIDNTAFEAADVSVGVINEETPDDLSCDYFVRYEYVATFLRALFRRGLVFSPRLAAIIQKTHGYAQSTGRFTLQESPFKLP